jgi:hypothetical protein
MLSNNLFECIDLIILDDEFEANAREWDAKEAYRRLTDNVRKAQEAQAAAMPQ